MAKHPELSEYMINVCVHILELIDVDGSIDAVIGEEQKRGLDVSAHYTRSSKEGCKDGYINHFYRCNLCNREEAHLTEIVDDYIYIGDCPEEENPFDKYPSRLVAKALVLQLNNTYVVPLGAKIGVKREEGGGGYYTVVCHYNTAYPYAVAFAYMLESNLPTRWSPSAQTFLSNSYK